MYLIYVYVFIFILYIFFLRLFLRLHFVFQGLLERLQMDQPVINLCIQGAKKEKALQAVMDAKEDLLVKYLSSCFIRCSHEEMILKSKVHKVRQLF